MSHNDIISHVLCVLSIHFCKYNHLLPLYYNYLGVSAALCYVCYVCINVLTIMILWLTHIKKSSSLICIWQEIVTKPSSFISFKIFRIIIIVFYTCFSYQSAVHIAASTASLRLTDRYIANWQFMVPCYALLHTPINYYSVDNSYYSQ